MKTRLYPQQEAYEKFARKLDLGTLHSFLPKASTIAIIHDNDPDGWCSAHLFKCLTDGLYGFLSPDRSFQAPYAEMTLHPVAHGERFQNLDIAAEIGSKVDVLVVLDQSCNQAMIDELSEHCRKLIVIDHHVETADVHHQKLMLIYDRRWSTTGLTNALLLAAMGDNYPAGGGLEAIAHLVNHYDSWQFGDDPDYDTDVKQFITLCFHRGVSKIDWNYLVRSAFTSTLELLIEEGRVIRDIQTKQTESIVKRNVLKFALGNGSEKPYTCAMVFHSNNIDELGSAILQADPDVDFSLVVYIKSNTDKPYKLSFRSTDDRADVQKIAAQLGGGGQRNAAGAQLSAPEFFSFFSPYL